MDAHLMPDASYQANLYPEPTCPPGGSPKLGVSFSGGGSRALSCALGQISALHQMQDSEGRSVLSQVGYLSSVSGGSWASVLFSFLPDSINGQSVTDDDFLIQPVDPASLVKGDPSVSAPGNVSHMGPFCLGTVPQKFNLTSYALFLRTLFDWGFFGDQERWRWFWIAAVGEIVLKPFGLYGALYDANVDFLQPAKFFSLSQDHLATQVTPCNPSLTADQFQFCRPGRPSLIVNANVLQNREAVTSAQIPMQAQPVETSVPGQSPDGAFHGGGGVESFAFSSTLQGAGSCATVSSPVAAVTLNRRYSLCDIAGCSSAFFAAFLLSYVNHEIDNLITELKRFLEKDLDLPEEIAGAIAKGLELAIEPFLDAEVDQVIPQYNYWPGLPGSTGNNTYGFSDGGDFENSGVLGLLSQTDVTHIIAFINENTPLLKNAEGTIVVDFKFARLFGYQGIGADGKWATFGGMHPPEPLSYAQVFSDDAGEFETMLQGLFAASSAGGAVGTAPAAFLQTLTTVENPVAHLAAGRQVQVLWVYNNRVNNWQHAITDPNLRNDLSAGQSSQPTGPLMNFPYYDTASQLFLDQEAVNMLAQLSAWNVQQLRPQILSLL